MPVRSLPRRFCLGLLALAFPAMSSAQTAEEEEFTKEFVWGININTNAGFLGGGMVKWTRPYKENLNRFLQIEAVEVKHPKEFRYVNDNTQNVFVLGKSNYLYVIRPQAGLEKILFRKGTDQGVQISAVGAAGLAIGLLKPYFIHYDYTPGTQPPQTDVRTEQYDPTIHGQVQNILGGAGFATNFNEAKIKPGFNARVGLTFEYGQFKERVTGIEVGTQFEQYFEELILVPESENKSSYMSVYLTLYYGKRK